MILGLLGVKASENISSLVKIIHEWEADKQDVFLHVLVF